MNNFIKRKRGTMATHETPLQQAIKWISERRRENPDAKMYNLIDEASQHFNLSPRDGEFLFNHFLTISPRIDRD